MKFKTVKDRADYYEAQAKEAKSSIKDYEKRINELEKQVQDNEHLNALWQSKFDEQKEKTNEYFDEKTRLEQIVHELENTVLEPERRYEVHVWWDKGEVDTAMIDQILVTNMCLKKAPVRELVSGNLLCYILESTVSMKVTTDSKKLFTRLASSILQERFPTSNIVVSAKEIHTA